MKGRGLASPLAALMMPMMAKTPTAIYSIHARAATADKEYYGFANEQNQALVGMEAGKLRLLGGKQGNQHEDAEIRKYSHHLVGADIGGVNLRSGCGFRPGGSVLGSGFGSRRLRNGVASVGLNRGFYPFAHLLADIGKPQLLAACQLDDETCDSALGATFDFRDVDDPSLVHQGHGSIGHLVFGP